MRLMLTSAGRRVQLIKHLKQNNYIVGTDSSDLVACKYFSDRFYKVPSFNCSDYLNYIIQIIKNEKIEMLIPLHEKEFSLLNRNRKKILEAGAILLLSSQEAVEVFGDKLKAYKFFLQYDISTPKTYTIMEALECKNLVYPLIIKPIEGMGSRGVFKADNKEELDFLIKGSKNILIQEFIEGTEYTIDALCNLDGDVITIVPRERMEVKSGEVSKSKTVKDSRIIDAVKDISDKINKHIGKLIGPITFQCIVDKSDEIKFIEINTRFGGGVPLTFEAGINYSLILNMILHNEAVPAYMREFAELIMLRFDDAVYIGDNNDKISDI